jgi:tRNA U34 5-methylaminomethyl-2-thiouridine-forming methyltransferase MnmC
MEPEIISTEDGSHSLYHTVLHETYHSRHGALTESRHVFIDNGLASVSQSGDPIRVLEVGFGTGLNALLTWLFARATERPVHYTGIEPFPVGEPTWRHLNYGITLNAEREFTTLHQVPWNDLHDLDPFFQFYKLKKSVEEFEAAGPLYDVVYYDAFAPEKQPEMWSSQTLGVVVESIRSGGIFVTYCAQGQFRRNLRALGMHVERLPGPPGKREMTRATKT